MDLRAKPTHGCLHVFLDEFLASSDIKNDVNDLLDVLFNLGLCFSLL